jgi:hypothetical protein
MVGEQRAVAPDAAVLLGLLLVLLVVLVVVKALGQPGEAAVAPAVAVAEVLLVVGGERGVGVAIAAAAAAGVLCLLLLLLLLLLEEGEEGAALRGGAGVVGGLWVGVLGWVRCVLPAGVVKFVSSKSSRTSAARSRPMGGEPTVGERCEEEGDAVFGCSGCSGDRVSLCEPRAFAFAKGRRRKENACAHGRTEEAQAPQGVLGGGAVLRAEGGAGGEGGGGALHGGEGHGADDGVICGGMVWWVCLCKCVLALE